MSAFRTNEDGSAACRHRDLSVCGDCATHPFVVEVYGQHFYEPNLQHRIDLKALLAEVAS